MDCQSENAAQWCSMMVEESKVRHAILQRTKEMQDRQRAEHEAAVRMVRELSKPEPASHTHTQIAPGWISYTAATPYTHAVCVTSGASATSNTVLLGPNGAGIWNSGNAGYERLGPQPSDTTDPTQVAMDTVRAMLKGAADEAKGAKVAGAINATHNARRSDGRPHHYRIGE